VKPAERLLQSGDYIVSVNGETVAGKAELVEKIDAFGEERETIGLLRDGTYLEVSVQPVRCEEDSYKIGVWVRDDLAGVGTLTYYRGDGSFGALGHAISDGDTGELFELSDGSLYKTTIVNIQRGEKGTPGELSGVIDYGAENYLGQITDNTAKGIHGILTDDAMALLGSESYEIGFKQEIKTEAAYIISSVAGERTQYEIQIESVDYHGREENKGILFRVTDERLIALTGGIVQGMSGSPIIQNGKLIGAVTHVLVQDSAKGYGIFIEKMIKE
jgi:stage IV sporulation protein B